MSTEEVFVDDEVNRVSKKWKTAILGKFLGKVLPMDFIHKEMRARWNEEGDF